MATFAYFLSEEYLKENAPIDDNVSAKLLKMAMRQSQEIYIRELIGSGIYDVMCDQINAAGLQAPYLALNDNFIKPCLINFIMYESMDTVSLQILNKGVMSRNSEHANGATINEITQFAARWRDKAQTYANRLTDYLKSNTATFPLYLNPGSDIDTIHPKNSKFYGGFFFDDDSDCIPNYNLP